MRHRHLFSFLWDFFVLFCFFLPSLHCILLGCGLPIHFVARSVLTDLGGAAGLTERSREINLRLFDLLCITPHQRLLKSTDAPKRDTVTI